MQAPFIALKFSKIFESFFSAIEMNKKSQCRDLCHTLPNCELWSHLTTFELPQIE